MEEYLKSLYEEIEKLFADEKSGHDVSHLLRVVDNARRIQEKEGGDKKVVLISALVHDVHRLMSNECGHFIFPRESLDKTKEIILQSGIKLTEYELEKILDIVGKHDDKESKDADSLELQIIKDADTLDSMGEIGLRRTLTYCKTHNIPLYDSSYPLDAKEYLPDINPLSCTHYVYRTMIPNAQRLRTSAAKELAKEYNKALEDFVKEQTGEFNHEDN